MTQLIIFRGIQGLGAGGVIPLAQAIIGEIFSPRERFRYQGYTGALFAASSIMTSRSAVRLGEAARISEKAVLRNRPMLRNLAPTA